MIEYWNSLDLFQQILTCLALPSSLLLIIQFIMIIIGVGPYRSAPKEEDEDEALPRRLNLFTFRGLLAFLSIGSWAAILAVSLGLGDLIGAVVGLVSGALAALLMAVAFNSD